MTEHFLQLGERNIYGGDHAFGLEPADRRHHLYVTGKTGVGKSTLMENMFIQDVLAGRGAAFIDPHGQSAEKLLDCVPSWRTDDVVYFNPTDYEFPIGLNLFQRVPPEERHRIASGIVGIFKKIWGDTWGSSRLQYIFLATVTALLDVENATLLAVPRMLSDERYRQWVIKQIKNPVVLSIWTQEYANYEKKYWREAIAPIQNKVGQLLMASPIRNILGQVRSTIDPAFMMNDKRIFIANLSKGTLGEDNSNLLGAALINQFQLAAMERATMPEDKRQDFSLFIDEFQNFSTDSFISIFSEMRKFRLPLVVATQYCDQVDEKILKAIFGNVGTMVSFRIGHRDAEILSKEYGDQHSPAQFTDLNNYEMLVRPLAHGHQGGSFFAKSLAPLEPGRSRRKQIIDRSHERFSTPRAIVEDKIQRWMEQ